MNFSLFFLRLFSIFGKRLIGNVNLGNLGNLFIGFKLFGISVKKC